MGTVKLYVHRTRKEPRLAAQLDRFKVSRGTVLVHKEGYRYLERICAQGLLILLNSLSLSCTKLYSN